MHKHDKIVKALGSTTVIAKVIGSSPQSVNQWKHKGIPWKFRQRIKDLCRERGISVPKDFMG